MRGIQGFCKTKSAAIIAALFLLGGCVRLVPEGSAPRPVTPRIDAGQTLPLGRDQPFILIEAQRARRDAEFFRQVGDAVALPVAMVGQFDARYAAAIVHGDRDNGTLRLRQGEWVGWGNLCR